MDLQAEPGGVDAPGWREIESNRSTILHYPYVRFVLLSFFLLQQAAVLMAPVIIFFLLDSPYSRLDFGIRRHHMVLFAGPYPTGSRI